MKNKELSYGWVVMLSGLLVVLMDVELLLKIDLSNGAYGYFGIGEIIFFIIGLIFYLINFLIINALKWQYKILVFPILAIAGVYLFLLWGDPNHSGWFGQGHIFSLTLTTIVAILLFKFQSKK